MSRRRSQFASPVADPDFCRFARAILCRARRAARCVPDANCERYIVQDIASLRSATLWRDALSRSLQYSRIICAGSCSRPNSRFTVDLKTAKALGLTVPNTLLVTVRSVVSSVRPRLQLCHQKPTSAGARSNDATGPSADITSARQFTTLVVRTL